MGLESGWLLWERRKRISWSKEEPLLSINICYPVSWNLKEKASSWRVVFEDITSTRECGHQLWVKCLTLALNQAITMTGLQWLSSKVILLWVIYLERVQELLSTS